MSAIRFIIYMDDVMEDNDALNRRSNLPTIIAPDRPAKQEKPLFGETIASKGKNNEPLQEQQIIRTIKNTQNNKWGEIDIATWRHRQIEEKGEKKEEEKRHGTKQMNRGRKERENDGHLQKTDREKTDPETSKKTKPP